MSATTSRSSSSCHTGRSQHSQYPLDIQPPQAETMAVFSCLSVNDLASHVNQQTRVFPIGNVLLCVVTRAETWKRTDTLVHLQELVGGQVKKVYCCGSTRVRYVQGGH